MLDSIPANYGEYQVAKPTFAGLERLLAIAVVDPHLAQRILTNPQALIDQEYEQFPLTQAERDVLLAINASDIYDVAAQVHERVQQDLWLHAHPHEGSEA